MFTEISQLNLRAREAELYRAAARQGQVRLALRAARAEKARENEGRGESGSGEVPAGASRRGRSRPKRAGAAGSC